MGSPPSCMFGHEMRNSILARVRHATAFCQLSCKVVSVNLALHGARDKHKNNGCHDQDDWMVRQNMPAHAGPPR